MFGRSCNVDLNRYCVLWKFYDKQLQSGVPSELCIVRSVYKSIKHVVFGKNMTFISHTSTLTRFM